MERNVSTGYSELISWVYELLPSRIAEKLKYTHFLTGTDPVYVGLHSYIDDGDGFSYRTCCHVAYDYHQEGLSKALRRTTIVLPYLTTPCVLVHELGHVLDEILGFRFTFRPVTEYAKANRYESFAESFVSWLYWDYGEEIDKEAEYIFSQI